LNNGTLREIKVQARTLPLFLSGKRLAHLLQLASSSTGVCMARAQAAAVGAIIERFYEAATRPELWPEVLHEAGEAVGGVAGILLPGPKAPVAAVWSRAVDEGVELGMREGWYENNPRVSRGVPALRGPLDVITERRIFTDEELQNHPFNAEFINRTGMGSFAGMLLAPEGASSVIVSFERTRNQEPFSEHDLAVIRRALPHLQGAGQLALRLGDAHAQGILHGLEMVACGAISLDFLGRVVATNQRAERHLRNGSLGLVNGEVLARDRAGNAALQKLVGSVLRAGLAGDGAPPAPVALPRPEGRPLIAHAAPIVGSARDLFQRAKAILMIVDPDEHREPGEPVLRQAFGLTPAETRIALGLAAGLELQEIAAAAGVTSGTARTQLKSIFAKTDTHRQSELVALIGRLSLLNVTRAE
jgi:DNA-binding CsgD family transcriptional regulator